MKTAPHTFVLTRSEQRVVILIMLVLLAGTAVKLYRDHESSRLPLLSPSSAIATPSPPTPEED
jgi:hypothetical protein